MATTGTQTEATDPADLASNIADAALVRVVSRADGDGLAAAAILGSALAERDIPRHLTVASPSEATVPDSEPGTVTIDVETLEAAGTHDSVALDAYETAAAMGTDPDPGLAIAGAKAVHVPPQGQALTDAEAQGLAERAGVGIPTPDLVSGLAYSGWLHASFSGDEDATEAFLDEHDLRPIEEDRTHLADAIALAVTDTMAAERTTDALAQLLGPQTSPTAFETVGGYADVLRAAAASDPGRGLVALLGDVDEDRLLYHWRSYGESVHAAVSTVSTDGKLATGTVDAVNPADVARLAHGYRVEADRVAIEGPDSVALAASEASARAELEAAYPDTAVHGTTSLATVQTEAGLDPLESASEVTR